MRKVLLRHLQKPLTRTQLRLNRATRFRPGRLGTKISLRLKTKRITATMRVVVEKYRKRRIKKRQGSVPHQNTPKRL